MIPNTVSNDPNSQRLVCCSPIHQCRSPRVSRAPFLLLSPPLDPLLHRRRYLLQHLRRGLDEARPPPLPIRRLLGRRVPPPFQKRSVIIQQRPGSTVASPFLRVLIRLRRRRRRSCGEDVSRGTADIARSPDAIADARFEVAVAGGGGGLGVVVRHPWRMDEKRDDDTAVLLEDRQIDSSDRRVGGILTDGDAMRYGRAHPLLLGPKLTDRGA